MGKLLTAELVEIEFEKQNIRVYEHISWCMPEWRDPTA